MIQLLIDSSISGQVARALREEGFSVEWVGEWGRDPGDEEILEAAKNSQRTIITLDKDFGELAVLRGERHWGILRIVDIAVANQAVRCKEILTQHAEALQRGAIVTVEPARVRVRAADWDD